MRPAGKSDTARCCWPRAVSFTTRGKGDNYTVAGSVAGMACTNTSRLPPAKPVRTDIRKGPFGRIFGMLSRLMLSYATNIEHDLPGLFDVTERSFDIYVLYQAFICSGILSSGQ